VVIRFTLLPLAFNLIIAAAPYKSVFLSAPSLAQSWKIPQGPKREEWSFTLQLQSKVAEPIEHERNF